MSFLARPSVVFAIIFGCFAVLVPRVFLPLFRSKSNSVQNQHEDRFRRPTSSVHQHDHSDNVEYISGSPPHLRGPHPGMRMHHQARPGGSTESTGSKSIVTLALPMYTVGIGVFFIYTCCKYWSKKNDECQTKNPNSKGKNKLDLDILDHDSEDDIADKTELYSNVDPDYLEYLKVKKQKALEAQQAMTEEQKQMHNALEEMKKSLSYISSKLVTKENRNNLGTDEIFRLQERLAATEAQMCQILTALDSASEKVDNCGTNSAQVPVNNEMEEISNDIDEEKFVETNIELDEKESSESEQSNFSDRSRSDSASSEQSTHDEDQSIPISQPNNLIRRRKLH